MYNRIKKLFRHKDEHRNLDYPVNPSNNIYVHLGCGAINSPEFINVDVRSAPHVHHVHSIEKLEFFEDNFADLIYACHVLEHVSFRSQIEVLSEWRRVLKPSGVLRISVPDFDKLLEIYDAFNCSVKHIIPFLFGYQDYASNFHMTTFNYSSLVSLLESSGFSNIRVWDAKCVDNHDFEDWASRKAQIEGREFFLSLNVEAVK